MSNLRNGRVSLSILGVKGHSGELGADATIDMGGRMVRLIFTIGKNVWPYVLNRRSLGKNFISLFI